MAEIDKLIRLLVDADGIPVGLHDLNILEDDA